MVFLRRCKIVPVLFFALFFTVVAFGNLTDYGTNREFVRHVLAMDSTYQDPDLMWRAIERQWFQDFVYVMIILLEVTAASTLWLGIHRMRKAVLRLPGPFQESKKWAMIGLTLGFSIFSIGFLVIGGEWFAMWQSDSWNAHPTAGMIAGLLLLSMIWLSQKEDG